MPEWYAFLKKPTEGSFILLSPDRSEERLVLTRGMGKAFPAIFLYAQDSAYELASGSLWQMAALRENFYRELAEEEAGEMLSRGEHETLLEESLLDAGLTRLALYRSLLNPEVECCIHQLIARVHSRLSDDQKREEARIQQLEMEETRDRKRMSLKADEVSRESFSDFVGNLAQQQRTRVQTRMKKGKLRQLYDKVRSYLRD